MAASTGAGMAFDFVRDYLPPELAGAVGGAIAGSPGGPAGAAAGFATGLLAAHAAEQERRENERKPVKSGRPYGDMSDKELQDARYLNLSFRNSTSGNMAVDAMNTKARDQQIALIDEEIAGRKAGTRVQGMPVTAPKVVADGGTIVDLLVGRNPGPASGSDTRFVPVHALRGLVRKAYDAAGESTRMFELSAKDMAAYSAIYAEFLERAKWYRADLLSWHSYAKEFAKTYKHDGDPIYTMPVEIEAGYRGRPGAVSRPALPDVCTVREAITLLLKLDTADAIVRSRLPKPVAQEQAEGETTKPNAAGGLLPLAIAAATWFVWGK